MQIRLITLIEGKANGKIEACNYKMVREGAESIQKKEKNISSVFQLLNLTYG